LDLTFEKRRKKKKEKIVQLPDEKLLEYSMKIFFLLLFFSAWALPIISCSVLCTWNRAEDESQKRICPVDWPTTTITPNFIRKTTLFTNEL